MEIIIIVLSFYIYVVYFLILLGMIPYKTKNTSAKKPKVSIIIATRDEYEIIRRTVKAIENSDYKNIEIIIVDGSKDDKTVNKIRKHVHKVIRDKGIGKGHAIKLGICNASGEFVYILDSDSEIKKNTISTLVSRLEKGYSGAAGSVIIRKQKGFASRMDRIIFAVYDVLERAVFRFTGTTMILGKNFIVYKKDMEKIRGYENSLTEDLEISQKLYENGKKIKFVPEAICIEQSPMKFYHYWKRQERWIRGALSEIIKLFKGGKSPTNYIFIYPVMITIFLLPFIIVNYTIFFVVFKKLEFLLIALVGLLLIFLSSVKSMDKYEILSYPLLFFLTTFVWIFGIIHSIIKIIFRAKTEWYKTPKGRL